MLTIPLPTSFSQCAILWPCRAAGEPLSSCDCRHHAFAQQGFNKCLRNEWLASLSVLGHVAVLASVWQCMSLFFSCFIFFSFVFSFQLCIMKDEPEEAELILHDALRLAHKSHNTKAIAYTYDLVTPLYSLSPRRWCRRTVSVPD